MRFIFMYVWYVHIRSVFIISNRKLYRTEPTRTEPSRTEPNRAEPNRTDYSGNGRFGSVRFDSVMFRYFGVGWLLLAALRKATPAPLCSAAEAGPPRLPYKLVG